ncbi:2039_t:CDS:2, partial [Cetraspora pellucida]
NSTRTFYHDYPNNPYINAQYIAGNKLFQSRYKIIELGYYPQNVKYTQKGKNIQYQIPNEYIIKTEVANQTKINRVNSRLLGVHVFGFDIEILHQIRNEKSNKLLLSRTMNNIINKRKKLLNEIQSSSQQKK